MKHHNLFLRSLSLVHEVENVVVRHPSRGDLLCFAQGDWNHRRRQTMCSRQCFHWHMCFRIGRFRFPKRKLWWRKSSSRSEQSSTVPVDVRCLRGHWFPRLNLNSMIADGESTFFLWQRRSADDIRAIDDLLSHWNLLSAFCSSLGRWDSLLVLEHRLAGTETDRDRCWSTSSGFIEPRSGIDDDDQGNSPLRQLHHSTLSSCSYTQFQVIYLHPRFSKLSLSILVSGKSRNRLEIAFWSNPVASSSGTISSIVSVAGQVSVDHSDRWRLFFEVHSPRLISFNLKFHSSRIDGFLSSLHRSILCSDVDPSFSATCLGWLDDLASEQSFHRRTCVRSGQSSIFALPITPSGRCPDHLFARGSRIGHGSIWTPPERRSVSLHGKIDCQGRYQTSNAIDYRSIRARLEHHLRMSDENKLPFWNETDSQFHLSDEHRWRTDPCTAPGDRRQRSFQYDSQGCMALLSLVGRLAPM